MTLGRRFKTALYAAQTVSISCCCSMPAGVGDWAQFGGVSEQPRKQQLSRLSLDAGCCDPMYDGLTLQDAES
jgi:hypothetical protein